MIATGYYQSIVVGVDGILRAWGEDNTRYVSLYFGGRSVPAIRLTGDISDTNQNAVPDSWESANLGDLVHNVGDDSDGDGISDYREYLLGTRVDSVDSNGDGFYDGVDPYGYYGGIAPTLSLIGGDKQYAYVGQYIALPLDAASWNSAGTLPLLNAPIAFTVKYGGGLLANATSDTFKFPLLVQSTDVDGSARAFYKHSSTPNVESHILVTAGASQKTFITTSVAVGDSDSNGLTDMSEYVNAGRIGLTAEAYNIQVRLKAMGLFRTSTAAAAASHLSTYLYAPGGPCPTVDVVQALIEISGKFHNLGELALAKIAADKAIEVGAGIIDGSAGLSTDRRADVVAAFGVLCENVRFDYGAAKTHYESAATLKPSVTLNRIRAKIAERKQQQAGN